ncbi:pentatricopeptide repeat-containing protein At1g74900, mitochondrial-like [Impatiens glandulifera]|uniref:pentatricopeptide repeat-containing protein At1g74900, mitochondrial-like n=1 Tax=Impatiens glandulifera TaxID=253017 RepID=UPI001FB096D5|nr:pentatricopeptide repeat-containing protein At1g74900, mitochondrial-like [Impatiens glandulifera]
MIPWRSTTTVVPSAVRSLLLNPKFSSHKLTSIAGESPLLSPPEASSITTLVINTDPRDLPSALSNYPVQWTPELVIKILKLLWNHGPKSLQFFRSLERHPGYRHSSAAFDHAIDIAARIREYKTVWTLVERMRSLRIGPTSKTFAIISERYVSAGKADKAVKVFLSMHHHGCHQDLNSFNTILDVLCKSRRAEKAYNLLRVFRDRFKADTISYNIIANGFCLIKRTPRALEVLKEMVERGLDPTLITYNTMLKGFFRSGQIKEAWKFFLQMKKRKCEIDVVTYTTVIHGLGVAGDVINAQKVFDEMFENGVLPSVATYNALIQVLCKKDNVENALVVLEKMKNKGYVPNLISYNVVIRGLCHAEEMDRAVEYMDRMKEDDNECKPNVQTYNIVIRYYCDLGEIDKGLEVYERMEKERCLPDLDTYNIMISGMFVRKKSEDLVMAGKLMIEMVDRGFMPRRFTFNRVLNGLSLTGNQEFAKQILRLQSKCARVPRHFRL